MEKVTGPPIPQVLSLLLPVGLGKEGQARPNWWASPSARERKHPKSVGAERVLGPPVNQHLGLKTCCFCMGREPLVGESEMGKESPAAPFPTSACPTLQTRRRGGAPSFLPRPAQTGHCYTLVVPRSRLGGSPCRSCALKGRWDVSGLSSF